MTSTTTAPDAPVLRRVAEWIVNLRHDDLPERLQPLLTAQLLSVAAATVAGRQTSDGDAVLKASRRVSASRRIPLPGGGTAGVLEALDLVTSWSMAQDYDDYMFLGHTGHSAIWTPLVVGTWLDASGAELRTAMAVANELGGRLGASLLLGPHNGQMWSPIHRIASAGAAAKLMGLDVKQTADAMGIALYDANDPVFHGFMGPGSKVRTAAGPCVAGLQAALLAAEGLDGAHDILEHERGFWQRFTFAPIRGTFRGLGENWVIDSLAVKPVPGCAYVDTTVDAVMQILSEAEEPIEPFAVDRIHVDAGLLTVGMDALSAERARTGELSPVVVNFSIPLTVAATLLFGGLTGADLTPEKLERHKDELLELADRVELRHDGHFTVELLRAFDGQLPLSEWLATLDLRTLLGLRRQARATVGGGIEDRVLRGVRKTLTRDDRRFLRRRILRPILAKILDPLRGFPPAELPLERVDFQQFRLPFPARVSMRMRNGRRYEATCSQPAGTAIGGDVLEVAEAKWMREAAVGLSKSACQKALERMRKPDTSAKELMTRLSG